MLKLKISSFFFSLFLMTQMIFSQNPITNAKGVSDPHIRVFNDTIYLYSGHDSSPNDKLWDMKDWRVFSSTNLLDWKLEQTISPKDNYMDNNSIDCWASDASARNGKYYFYFSDKKRGIGVMSSNSPTGPFKDALGKPLVAPMHDPTIFIDDDKNKTPYIIYGDKSDSYYIAELNEDMISTAETPKPIAVNGNLWDKAPKWMDKNYVFKHNDTYYLSWGRDYAISKNIYGPYESAGSFGTGHKLDEFAHGSFFYWKGQYYHVWCYYLKNGLKFRETIITYCHVGDDGKIVSDTAFLDKHFKNGVGQYDASWEVIEAEWFYEKSSEIEKKGIQKEGFKLTNVQNKSWVKFANINFNQQSKIEVSLKNIQGKGKLEIREGSISGKILGSISVKSLNLKEESQKFIATIKEVVGKKDIYLVFKGNRKFKTEFDSFSFHK
ncbi:family 43 glycosylhydrolase [Polaribacter glomeratus]|nr:family 43 glycosylhydrolase [Polaribacter glomeratus]TXD67599.1 family 43 glycosylhydrolase [Polaribacter glomeratus]